LYLGGAGVVGLGAYVYMEYASKLTGQKKVQEKSPLDPENFVDFKLKKVERYNHNTSKFASDYYRFGFLLTCFF
jgi:cytochrome-b5 reductase